CSNIRLYCAVAKSRSSRTTAASGISAPRRPAAKKSRAKAKLSRCSDFIAGLGRREASRGNEKGTTGFLVLLLNGGPCRAGARRRAVVRTHKKIIHRVRCALSRPTPFPVFIIGVRSHANFSFASVSYD